MQQHASTKTYLTDIGNALAPERRLVKDFLASLPILMQRFERDRVCVLRCNRTASRLLQDPRYSSYADRGIVAHQESLHQAGCSEKQCFATAGHRYTCNTWPWGCSGQVANILHTCFSLLHISWDLTPGGNRHCNNTFQWPLANSGRNICRLGYHWGHNRYAGGESVMSKRFSKRCRTPRVVYIA